MKEYFAVINCMNGLVHFIYKAKEIPKELVEEENYYPINQKDARKYKRLLGEKSALFKRLEELNKELKLPSKSLEVK